MESGERDILTYNTIYERKTGDVVVRVEPDFLAEQSSPSDDRYIWAYTVEIENQSQSALQVVGRCWNIADCRGQVQEVRGSGVVGEQPVLQPGEVFRYTSGAPLTAPSGMMHGTYSLQNPEGQAFDVDIPVFSLDSPHERRVLN